MLDRSGLVLLSIALLLSIHDIYGNFEHHSEDDHDNEDAFSNEFGDEQLGKVDDDSELPIREPSSRFIPPRSMKELPQIKFLFCVSCGYRQAFNEFSRSIHEKYPNVQVSGSNYPPSVWKSIFAQVIGFGKIAVIIVIVMGLNIFNTFGMQTPALYQWMLNNKLSSCMMLFLLSNIVESSLISTGAFEIYLGKEQIWSKLESGRVPSPSELLQIVDQHMELVGTKISDTFAHE